VISPQAVRPASAHSRRPTTVISALPPRYRRAPLFTKLETSSRNARPASRLPLRPGRRREQRSARGCSDGDDGGARTERGRVPLRPIVSKDLLTRGLTMLGFVAFRGRRRTRTAGLHTKSAPPTNRQHQITIHRGSSSELALRFRTATGFLRRRELCLGGRRVTARVVVDRRRLRFGAYDCAARWGAGNGENACRRRNAGTSATSRAWTQTHLTQRRLRVRSLSRRRSRSCMSVTTSRSAGM